MSPRSRTTRRRSRLLPQQRFAAFMVSSDAELIVSVRQAKKPNRKKKKKAAKATGNSPSAAASFDSPADSPSIAATPTKGKSKKAKAAKAETPKVEDDGMDEIDRALAELAVKGGDAQATAGTTSTTRLDPKWTAVKEVRVNCHRALPFTGLIFSDTGLRLRPKVPRLGCGTAADVRQECRTCRRALASIAD